MFLCLPNLSKVHDFILKKHNLNMSCFFLRAKIRKYISPLKIIMICFWGEIV